MAALPIQVNLIPGYNHVPPVVKLNQYEYGFTRQFEVYYGDVIYNIPVNSEIRFEGTKPDGKGFSYNTGINISGNVITVTIFEQMTACSGRYYAELTILPSSGVRVATINVIMDIERGALNESTDISNTDLPAIIDLARSNAETAVSSAAIAEESASAASIAKTDAEAAADLAAQSASQANTSKNEAANSATAAAASAQGILDHEMQTKDYMDAAELAANRAEMYVDITIPGLRIDAQTMNLIEDEDYDRLYFVYNSSNGQLSYELTS